MFAEGVEIPRGLHSFREGNLTLYKPDLRTRAGMALQPEFERHSPIFIKPIREHLEIWYGTWKLDNKVYFPMWNFHQGDIFIGVPLFVAKNYLKEKDLELISTIELYYLLGQDEDEL